MRAADWQLRYAARVVEERLNRNRGGKHCNASRFHVSNEIRRSVRSRFIQNHDCNVTTLSNNDVSDDVYEQGRAQFSEAELVNLTLAVIAINGWNRLNIAFRTTPGTYQVGMAFTA